MAIFNQPATPKKDIAPPPTPVQPESALKREPDPANEFSFAQSAAPAPVTAARTAPSAEPMAKESLIASDLTIEGKIGDFDVTYAGAAELARGILPDLGIEVTPVNLSIPGALAGGNAFAVVVHRIEEAVGGPLAVLRTLLIRGLAGFLLVVLGGRFLDHHGIHAYLAAQAQHHGVALGQIFHW